MTQLPTKRKIEMHIFVLRPHVIFLFPSTGWSTGLKTFNLSWIIVQISYHRFNSLAKLLNRDLATKIGQVILFRDLMYRECNCFNPYKFNVECIYKGRFRKFFSIYVVKCSTCDAIYIGNTQKKTRKQWMAISLMSNVFLKMDKNQTHLLPTSINTYKSTTSHKDLRKCMKIKVVNQIYPIGSTK